MRLIPRSLATAAVVVVLAVAGSGLAAGSASAAVSAPAYACAYYDGNALTVYGDTGDRVRQVQCLLSQWHYLTLRDIDGDFGPKTLAAVRSFQGAHHVLVDGKVGVHTWAALWGG